MFDLIIISYNTRKLVAECIDSAIDTSCGLLNKIIVVDNNSSDDTVDFLRKNYPNVEIICNKKNMGYSFAVNCGVRCADSPLLLISNSDIVFLEGAIENLAKLFNPTILSLFRLSDKSILTVNCNTLSAAFPIKLPA